MISLAEVDLASSPEPLAPVEGEVWVLVRHGPLVLGEVRLERLDARRAGCLHAELAARFGRGGAAAREEEAALPPDSGTALTVVVCTRDRPQLLAGCLDSLLALEPVRPEIIVVDNAPAGDDTSVLCDQRGVRRVIEPEPGLDRARNRGWEEARGDVVAYVDDDSRPDRWYADELKRAYRDPRVAAVTGLVLAATLDTPARVYFERSLGGMRKGFERRFFQRDVESIGVESFRIGVGTNMSFRRSVLVSLGGFDPRLDVGTATRGGGDLDMLYRVYASGATIAYEPSVLVRHVHRADRRALLEQLADNGTSYRAFVEARIQQEPSRRRELRRYLRRWHLGRHIVGPVCAGLRGDLLGVRAALAEARGSWEGRSALAAETARASA